ncbi:MAG: nicotinamide-nucleotide amidohydrolase family protein [Clostridia bacterium]|nr:nicotinamide-nucleotide amidohydrolase family protein [Clostridia bacterium]
MDKLFELLKKHNLTISTAESCTGGLIASAITDVSGASSLFGTGVVTYSNDAKMKLIGVKKETLDQYGAVSEQTAFQMAEGVLKLADSDVSVAVTGIAGPTGGTPEKPVGLGYIGVSGKYGTFAYKNIFKGNRDEVRKQTVSRAFELVYDYLSKFYG